MTHWTQFGLSPLPPRSARQRAVLQPQLQALVDERVKALAEPLRGLTADGDIRPGLFPLRATGVSTTAITQAAIAFLGSLDAGERERATFPLAADERRQWFNIHPFLFRHGVMLEDLAPATRRLAVEVMRASLSARGFAQARDIMRVNGMLVELTGRAEDYGEWPYFFSLFGEPGAERPWAWQVDGHHLCLNCAVIGDQVVLSPAFMGSEPCHVLDGPLAGTMLFTAEERAGLDLIRSLDGDQAARAILRPSIHPDDLPPGMQDPFDGRMLSGALRDNAVIPYAGLPGSDLSERQRSRLRALLAAYAGWLGTGHCGVRMAEIDRHLDETHFAWMGGAGDDDPFYYRVHSPVVLIEFDHHPGVVFDNRTPSPNHIHTIVRTPNGGDYGLDLLRQHHELFDHSDGTHRARS